MPKVKFDLTTPFGCFHHAVINLKRPYRKGEVVISKDAEFSYRYACYVLEGPFPLGEYAIARSHKFNILYANFILQDSDPKSWGERYLKSHRRVKGSYDPWKVLREV